MQKAKPNFIKRRSFLLTSATGLAAFYTLPRLATSAAERLTANNKLNIAGIGIGGMGAGDLEAVARLGHNIVALCDVDERYAAKTFEKYPGARRFADFRLLFDEMDKEIDAVIIATPDHTHAVIAVEAMRRHKHVYCEKPLTHSIGEVRALIQASRKHKVVTQLGNQGHSFDSIRQVCEWVWSGAIGRTHTIHAGCDAFKSTYCQIGNLTKINKHYDTPPCLDYDLWIGPVPFRPYTPFWVPGSWRGWMPFGTGTIGDWLCHVVDPAFWALDLDAPTSVQAEVEGYDPVEHALTYPPGSRITFEFPGNQQRGPITLVWHDGNIAIPRPKDFEADEEIPGVGAILFGDKGAIVHGSHGGSNCRLVPESLMEQNSGNRAPARKLPRVKSHHWDWIEAIRSGRQAGSNFEYGGRLTQVALLGAIAVRFPGQKLLWDNREVRFTNNSAANTFVKSEYRKGWKL